jgi:hypothetical protein
MAPTRSSLVTVKSMPELVPWSPATVTNHNFFLTVPMP